MKDFAEMIAGGESESVEFKPSLSQTDKIMETVSAFSNTEGGVIVVGISDKGNVLGVGIGSSTLENLANDIKRNTDPPIFPSLEAAELEGKNLILIKVSESSEKPVFFKDKAYKRVGRTNQRISASEIRKMAKEEKKKLNWDERICDGATLEDIDEESARRFLRNARSERGLDIDPNSPVGEVLTQLGLIKEGVTNAAVLLFGKNPERFFLQSEIKCILLPTSEFVKPYTSYQAYGGNLFDQVDKTLAYVLENINRPLWLERGKAAAMHPYEIHEDAVREAIANAVAHRDYESSSKVQMRLFPDRIEIWNPGCLPEKLQVGDLKKPHPSLPKNPLIFKQFYRAGYVEDVGGGTLDIMRLCKEKGLPEPEFEEKMGSFVTTMWRYLLTEEYLKSLGLNERQKEILEYLKTHKSIKSAEYSIMFKITDRQARADLSKLVELGLARKEGNARLVIYVLNPEISGNIRKSMLAEKEKEGK